MLFSQRIQKKPIEKLIQKESIDVDLKNSLWNALTIFYWDKFKDYNLVPNQYTSITGSNLEKLIYSLWLDYFKEPVDTIPSKFYEVKTTMKTYFFQADWFEIYDFIEFVPTHGPHRWKGEYIEAVNAFLERENSAYRFIEETLTEITSEIEAQSIEIAIEKSTPYHGTKKHLQTALSLMSNRKKPDYRNSIKESISAVESLSKIITSNKKTTLGEALKILEKDYEIHPALKSAFSALYGYTNDEGGIRHALLEEDNLTKADAKFMLVTCSAFINYVIEMRAMNGGS